MKTKLVLLMIFGCSFGAIGQNKPIPFSLLRQYDEIAALKPMQLKNKYQKFKYIALSNNSSLSFGGSFRFQYESFINEQFQQTPDQDNLWFLNRILVHAHLKIRDKFEIFVEFNSSHISGKTNVSPVDKDALSINQLFANYNISQNLSFGIGRQNLRLGSGRLVDVREGPNVRRAFDLAHVNFRNNKFVAKGFFAIPVKARSGIFDNDFLEFDETFLGLYTTTRINTSNHLDLYTFYQKDDNVTYNYGTENERRTSVGARYFGTYKSWTYNNELVYQFGNFGNQSINAYTVSLKVEKKTTLSNHMFNIGLKTEIISGDKDANDNRLNTFDALYPRGAYFGRVARFGPSNLIDFHPYINTQFKKLFIEFDYDIFWRYSTNDGVYNAALLLEYPSTNNQRFIGQQLGTIVGYKINKHINLEFESNIIFPGAFLKQSNQGDTLYHFVFTTEIKF